MRLLLLFTLLHTLPLSAQSVRYVDADATGAATGLSWADAFPTLSAALAITSAGDELWVAEGVYTPTAGTDRAATFQLRSGVALYGGFAGMESARSERDWALHPTVLSGDIGVPGVHTDNSYHVVTGSGTAASAVLDGFTVTRAYANGVFPRNRGGGMRNVAGSPTVAHCVFRENTALFSPDGRAAFGGGMWNESGSNPSLSDVRFEHNVTGGGTGANAGIGAGMANRASHPTLRRVVFFENEAGALGGGMTNDAGSSPLLVDVRFERNRSAGWTGGMDNYQSANPRLYNVVFLGNVAANYGGGMTNDTDSAPLLVNVAFVGNVAQNGGGAEPGAGGLQNNGSSPTLVGVTFVGNTAADGAGALGHRGTGTVTVRSSVLWDNSTALLDETGGALNVSHAIVEGGFAAGTAVLDADPLFVRPPTPGPDALWATPDDDYGSIRLQPGSPALDAGLATHLPPDTADLDGDGDTAEPVPVDLEGDTRAQGSALDLGPYEGATAVAVETPPAAPDRGSLGAIYPNPTRGAVTFPFTLSAPTWVEVTVFDALGRRVAVPTAGLRAQGEHRLQWTAAGLAPGLYLVTLTTNTSRSVRTVLVE